MSTAPPPPTRLRAGAGCAGGPTATAEPADGAAEAPPAPPSRRPGAERRAAHRGDPRAAAVRGPAAAAAAARRLLTEREEAVYHLGGPRLRALPPRPARRRGHAPARRRGRPARRRRCATSTPASARSTASARSARRRARRDDGRAAAASPAAPRSAPRPASAGSAAPSSCRTTDGDDQVTAVIPTPPPRVSDERRTGWEGADEWFAPAPAAAEDAASPAAPPEPRRRPRRRRAARSAAPSSTPDQTYCLECGSPTPLAPRLRRGGKGIAAAGRAPIVILGLGVGALAYAVVPTTTAGPAGRPARPTVHGADRRRCRCRPRRPSTGPLPPDTVGHRPRPRRHRRPGPPTQTGFDTVTGPGTPPTDRGHDDRRRHHHEGADDRRRGARLERRLGLARGHAPPGRRSSRRCAASRTPAPPRRGPDRAGRAGRACCSPSDFPACGPATGCCLSGTLRRPGRRRCPGRALRREFPGAYARRIEG